jgi:glycosyltransferase involved in cell wall biosynthesis
MDADRKVVVVMPAYNAEKTLKLTYADLPHDHIDHVILVDDHSQDATVQIAQELGLEVYVHNRNYGYGANQKTCYTEALKAGATIVVMVHPDYQYDPKLLPDMIQPIVEGRADVVLGSRMLAGSALWQGMPWWKYLANRFLTWLENEAFGLNLSEYHTGYRAYTQDVLRGINFQSNSDGFIFDQEIIAQIVLTDYRIAEISVPVRYFPEASSAGLIASTFYGLQILWLLLLYKLQCWGLISLPKFVNLRSRVTRLDPDSPRRNHIVPKG